MKITLPKEVVALAAEISAKRQTIEQHRADIARADTTAKKADEIAGEIEALSRKRAEHKALAFVAGKPADVAELDRKQDELERGSRQAREDGVSAALAITMLEAKIGEAEAEIEQLAEQRKSKTLEWFAAQREKAVDRYLDALRALGPITADAMAIESARRQVTGEPFRFDDLFKAVRTLEFPIPHNRKLDVGKYNDRYWRTPIEWMLDSDHGKPEREQLLALLQEQGVL